ncbi:MAG: hypothetical protein EHM59_13200 [Betaproteobacteria bacterium]|nr:MAG: hypothetical protein EHM59_13200 [Betaproteobacteria bacterium]
MFRIGRQDATATLDAQRREARLRHIVFLLTFVVVAASGLAYNFSREPVYRATARLSVEPPGPVEDPLIKTQFALAEAQVLRGSALTQAAVTHLEPTGGALADPERRLSAEVLAQTSVIELRADGREPNRLVSVLSAWIDAYLASRKATDRQDESEALEEARHAAREAEKSVQAKRQEMETFRRQHGIASIEREENQGAARLKGVHTALNDAATKEVTAEARLKSVEDSISQGKAVIRNADKPAIANLEMRAVDLREKMKDLEHDYTPQYLAHDPKFKALKANLSRVEQQIQTERERSQKAALVEAQEEYAAAQRATQKIREQANALKQETQSFSMRFADLKRMAVDLEELQNTRRQTREHLARLESARKPSEAKIRVLATPSAGQEAISPDYTRDAAIALAAALGLAVGAVWLTDYLRREKPGAGGSQPVIQIAYPMLNQQHPGAVPTAQLSPAATPLLASEVGPAWVELGEHDVKALWGDAPADGKLILAALFTGIAPDELVQLRWKHVALDQGSIDIPGTSARRLKMLEPLRRELAGRVQGGAADPEAPVLADGSGNALDEAGIDSQLACIAHDAGLRHPEEVTGRALHFTYAAFLARQGVRMSDLTALVGRFTGTLATELMRLAPPGRAQSLSQVDVLHPSFRTS